jgi:hypothetical protein
MVCKLLEELKDVVVSDHDLFHSCQAWLPVLELLLLRIRDAFCCCT